MCLKAPALAVCLTALLSVSPPLEAAENPSLCAAAFDSSPAADETGRLEEYQRAKELAQMYVREMDIISKEEYIQFVMEERPEGLSLSPKRDFPDEFEGWDIFLGLPAAAKAGGGNESSGLEQPEPPEKPSSAPPPRGDESSGSERPAPPEQASSAPPRAKLKLPGYFNKENWLSQSQFERFLAFLDIRAEKEYASWLARLGIRAVPVFHVLDSSPGSAVFLEEEALWRAALGRPKKDFQPSGAQRNEGADTAASLTGAERGAAKAARMEKSLKLPRHPDRFYPDFFWRRHAEKMFQLKGGRRMKQAAFSAKDAPPLEVFENLLLSAGIFRRKDYRKWIQTEEAQKAAEPYRLPFSPEHSFPGFSFQSWAARNGQKTLADRVSSKDAPSLEFFENLLSQNNIVTRAEYLRWFRTAAAKELARPYKLPSNVVSCYPGFSWAKYAAKTAAAGGRRIRSSLKKEDVPPLEIFESLLQRFNIRTKRAYLLKRKTEEMRKAARPYKLPVQPRDFYPGFSWKRY